MFQKQAGVMLHAASDDNGGDDDSFWGDDNTEETYTGAEFDGIGEEEDDEHRSAAEGHYQTQLLKNSLSDGRINAEHISLHLSSHLGPNWCSNNAAGDLVKAELQLREGQLNDSLHHICIALGHKSYLFRNSVRPARTQKLKTRAWAEVHAVESTVQHHARVYNHARRSILNLGAGASLLDRYKVLEPQDLKTETTVIAPDVRGQRNKSLPWFWSMDVRRDSDIGAWMNDCRCISVQALSYGSLKTKLNAVYQVHWLRAKAQKERWIEELQCLQVEMESAVRYFRHQEIFWEERQQFIDPLQQPGHAAWAARQSAMWHSMAMQAGSRFRDLLKSHLPPDFAKVIQPHSNRSL